MKRRLSIALRRNARLARQLIAPAMLALGLSMFGLSQVAPASTVWYETLTIGGSAATGAFSCKPLVVTGATVTTAGSGPTGTTTFTYTLNGGGDKSGSPQCASMELSYLALPVCFAPVPEISAHTEPPSWTYAPVNAAPYQAKWTAGPAIGAGPFTNALFSITIAGSAVPTEQVQALVFAGAGPVADAGLVTVPKPESCTAGARLASGPGTSSVIEPGTKTDSPPDAGDSAPTATPSTTVVTGPTGTAAPAKTATPLPTSTPRITPTPRTGPGGAFIPPTVAASP